MHSFERAGDAIKLYVYKWLALIKIKLIFDFSLIFV